MYNFIMELNIFVLIAGFISLVLSLSYFVFVVESLVCKLLNKTKEPVFKRAIKRLHEATE